MLPSTIGFLTLQLAGPDQACDRHEQKARRITRSGTKITDHHQSTYGMTREETSLRRVLTIVAQRVAGLFPEGLVPAPDVYPEQRSDRCLCIGLGYDPGQPIVGGEKPSGKYPLLRRGQQPAVCR